MHSSRIATLASSTALATLLAATAANACPPGFFRNRWGRCVPIGRVVAPVVVPAGCPAGYVMNRYGRCVPAVVNPRVCPPGYFYFRGRCVHR